MMLTIADAVRVLRGWTGVQLRGSLMNKAGARCAIGVLGHENLGVRDSPPCAVEGCEENHGYGYIFMGEEMGLPERRIGAMYGLPPYLTEKVIRWNDHDKLSLSEIADKIEEYANGLA